MWSRVLRVLNWFWFLTLLLVASSVHAQSDLITIEDVEFGLERPVRMRENWYQIEIEIQCGRSSNEDNSVSMNGYIRNVGINLEMAFETGNGEDSHFEFYRSSVAMPALEENESITVYFYLPPEIVERDRLSREPEAWRVQTTVNGTPLPNRPGSFSNSLSKPAAAQSFASRVIRESRRNAGILQPIYMTPFFDGENEQMNRSPSYVRSEAGIAGGSPINRE